MAQKPMKGTRNCNCGGTSILAYIGVDLVYLYCEKCLKSGRHELIANHGFNTEQATKAATANWNNHN